MSVVKLSGRYPSDLNINEWYKEDSDEFGLIYASQYQHDYWTLYGSYHHELLNDKDFRNRFEVDSFNSDEDFLEMLFTNEGSYSIESRIEAVLALDVLGKFSSEHVIRFREDVCNHGI